MTNILLLPQISVAFEVATNSDWTDSIQFMQPAPNDTQPLDISGIEFRQQVRTEPGAVAVLLDLSTMNGLLVNGGTNGTLTYAVPAFASATGPNVLQACMALLRGYSTLSTDIVAIADGHRKSLCEKAGPGTITVNAGVTL